MSNGTDVSIVAQSSGVHNIIIFADFFLQKKFMKKSDFLMHEIYIVKTISKKQLAETNLQTDQKCTQPLQTGLKLQICMKNSNHFLMSAIEMYGF